SYSYRELDHASRYVATLLQSSGISQGTRVAILGENSPHWGIAYFGILTAGATTVPILPDFKGPEVTSILEHAEARALFVSGKLISKFESGFPSAVELVINLDNFQVLDVDHGKIVKPELSPGKLVKLVMDPGQLSDQDSFYRAQPEELASIIYTSGTTGRSKGVMLTHHNILSNAKQSRTVHAVVPEDRFLSMLPLAHTYECTIGMVVPLLNGATVHYMDRPPTASYLTPLLQKLAPTTMLTVPLIIEKIYRSKIKPALYKSPLTRFLMKMGVTRRILSKAASRKLQKFFGGRLRFYGVGGAPLAPDVEKFLIEGGFPYAIGYGLTETSPMVAGFDPSHAVFKSVGTVMEGVIVKIDNPDPITHEGEIIVKGPNVMKGYYKDEEKTKEVLTEDGFFRTGDLGYLSKKGILYIRGRLKNMILGPNGENIYPEEIEAVINSKDVVSESLVMQYKGNLVARVHLKVEVLEEQVKHLKENATDFQKQLESKGEEVLDELLIQVNQLVSKNARLHVMILQVQPFEKTPTQKIKRFLYH
ncbi:MAG: AMP-binding protein, partial [Bacteroidales bacterium]|nr:AMP-binding protein [Bacteroidales bacterium]